MTKLKGNEARGWLPLMEQEDFPENFSIKLEIPVENPKFIFFSSG